MNRMTVKERLMQEDAFPNAVALGEAIVSGYIRILAQYATQAGIPSDVAEKHLVSNREKMLETLYATEVNEIKGMGISLAFNEETEPMMIQLRLLASEYALV